MRKKIYKKMISSMEDYQGVIYLVCCIGVEYDYDIVLHFVKHYKEIGVDKFLLILNTEDENSEKLKYVQNILRKYDIKEEVIWIGDFQDTIKTQHMKQVVLDNANLEDWIVIADVDEFQKYYMDLRKLISYCDKMNYNCVMGEFVDRLTESGKIVDINEDINIWEVFPIKTSMKYWNDTEYSKVLLKKAYVEVEEGHHCPVDDKSCSYFPSLLEVHHFKWRGKILDKLKYRIEMYEKYDHWKGEGDGKVLKRYEDRGMLR